MPKEVASPCPQMRYPDRKRHRDEQAAYELGERHGQIFG
jgi:hypothetical protein